MQKGVDAFEQWKEIVSGGQLETIKGMTFFDFLAKLDRAIDRNRKEIAQANKKNG